MPVALANFLFEAVNFLLLALGLGWVLFRPVRKALDNEQERHAQELKKAQEARSSADALLAEIKSQRESLAQELAGERQKALAALDLEQKRARDALQEELKSQQEALNRSKTEAERAEVEELIEAIAAISARSVRTLLEQCSGPDLDHALCRAACDQLKNLSNAAKSQARVEVSREMDDAMERELTKALGHKPSTTVNPHLGAGIIITTQDGQVDASALGIARFAALQVQG